MAQALVDNDVLIKFSAYGLLTIFLESKPFHANTFSMLGAAKYVVPKSLKKKLPSELLGQALQEFQNAQEIIETIEPTTQEIQLAADLEFAAQKSNLDLDNGESLLCAVLIHRIKALIFTGDKRAIIAIGGLTEAGQHQNLCGHIVCLEQLFLWLLHKVEDLSIGIAICKMPAKLDTGLSICFGCYSGGSSIESTLEGLTSHIADLERKAPGVLIKTDQFFKNTA